MKDGAAAKTTAAYKIKSAFIVLDKHFEKHQHVSLEKEKVKNNEHRPVTFNCSELKNELLALSAPNQTQSSSTMQHKYMHI